jgi:hypothetical protein
MTAKIIEINFYGKPLIVINNNGIDYIALDPIMDRFGFDKYNRPRNIDNYSDLKSALISFTKISIEGKSTEIVCLPLKRLNNWLDSFDLRRYKLWRREEISRFRNECFNTVCEHLYPGILRSQKTSITTSVEVLADKMSLMIAEFKKDQVEKKQLEAENAQLVKTLAELNAVIERVNSIPECASKVYSQYLQK